MYTCMHVYMYTNMHVNMHAYKYTCMFVCVYVYMYLYVYACMYMYWYVGMYYVCVCMNYVCTQQHVNNNIQQQPSSPNLYTHLPITHNILIGPFHFIGANPTMDEIF